MSVEEMYSHVSSRYEDIVSATKYLGPEYLQKKLVNSKLRPKEIVDLGCATGLLGEILIKKYPDTRLVGYDISPAMIELAEKKNIYDQLIVQDLNFSLSAIQLETVDLMVGFGFSEFLEQPIKLLQNLSELLSLEGRVFLSFQEYWPDNATLAPRTTHSGKVTHHAYSKSEVLEMFLKAGFSVNKIESVVGYVSNSGFKCPYLFVDAGLVRK